MPVAGSPGTPQAEKSKEDGGQTAPVLCSVIPGDLPPVFIERMAGEVDIVIPKDTSAALVKLDLLKEAEHIPQG